MLEFFFKGGAVMYPLLLCSVLTVAYGMERGYHYLRAGRGGGSVDRVRSLAGRGEFDEALALAEGTPGPVAAVLAEALRNRGRDAAALEESVSLKGSIELRRLTRNLHVLELTGRMSPLLGLLGTVLGMVEAFKRVASAQGSVDPSLLAGGIWEALITTVAGLCVAIPALVMHHFFEDRMASFAFRMKHHGSEMVKLLGGKRDRV
jgi:biopolymer transport protein ExbB